MGVFPVLCVIIIGLIVGAIWRLLYKLWVCPISVQKKLIAQGLKGPSYKFLYGNKKEGLRLRQEAIKSPCEVSQVDLFPRILPHYHAWSNLYGNNFFYWEGPEAVVVITEPELVKEVLNKDEVFRKVKTTGHAKKYLGDGLVVSEGEKWTRLRKVANHAFHGECLKHMFLPMVASVEKMLERWAHHNGGEIEVTEEFRVLTSEVISRTAFGSSYLEGKNIFEKLTELGTLIFRNIYKLTFFGLEKIWRYNEEIESTKMEQSLRESIISLVGKREEKVKAGQADGFGNDYLGSLLTVHHDPDPTTKISVDDIVDECKVFYVAGHETTSALLPWIIIMFCNHPEWQEKARKEVFQFFGKDNPTLDGVTRMKIMTMVVNEVLRLYSPVVNFNRQVHTKTKLGPYEIPAHVKVHVPPLALHRNPKIWGNDAHLFNPERFSEGVANATKGNPGAFLPFGFGPRMCVGSNFAMNEIKIALAMILQRYRLALSPTYVHFPFQFLTISAKHGVQIVLHPLKG